MKSDYCMKVIHENKDIQNVAKLIKISGPLKIHSPASFVTWIQAENVDTVVA